MPKFIASGHIKLSGVDFHFEAANIEEAKAMIAAGERGYIDTTPGEVSDWEVDSLSVYQEDES